MLTKNYYKLLFKHIYNMKKIILIAFAVLTVGFVSSCTKDNSVKPSVKATTKIAGDGSTTGTADGSPP